MKLHETREIRGYTTSRDSQAKIHGILSNSTTKLRKSQANKLFRSLELIRTTKVIGEIMSLVDSESICGGITEDDCIYESALIAEYLLESEKYRVYPEEHLFGGCHPNDLTNESVNLVIPR